jgi:hypothetical protein
MSGQVNRNESNSLRTRSQVLSRREGLAPDDPASQCDARVGLGDALRMLGAGSAHCDAPFESISETGAPCRPRRTRKIAKRTLSTACARASSGARRGALNVCRGCVVKHRHEPPAVSETRALTREKPESGRRESNPRSQLGKLMFCR